MVWRLRGSVSQTSDRDKIICSLRLKVDHTTNLGSFPRLEGSMNRLAPRRRARPPDTRKTPDTRSRPRFRLDVHATLAPALRLARDTPGGACTRRTDGLPRRDAGCDPCRSRRLWRPTKPTTPRLVRANRSRDHRGADTAPRRRLSRLVTAGIASAAMDRGRG